MKPLGWPRLDQDGRRTDARIASRATEARRARAEIAAGVQDCDPWSSRPLLVYGSGPIRPEPERVPFDDRPEWQAAADHALARGLPAETTRSIWTHDVDLRSARSLSRPIAAFILAWISARRALRESADPLTHHLEILL